jgi:hypothetical protein
MKYTEDQMAEATRKALHLASIVLRQLRGVMPSPGAVDQAVRTIGLASIVWDEMRIAAKLREAADLAILDEATAGEIMSEDRGPIDAN